MNTTIVVGGGPVGLIAAYLLKKRDPSKHVILVERGEDFGGRYGSYFSESGVVSDHGMHLIYDSGITEIDDVFLEVMPEDEWNIVRGNYRDIAGCFFNGSLEYGSPYPNVVKGFGDSLALFRQDYFSNVNQRPNYKSWVECSSAEDYYVCNFGQKIYKKVFEPILLNLYGHRGDCLDAFVVNLTALNRIILFESDLVKNIFSNERLRLTIGFPDQLNLPFVRSFDQRGLYPKMGGMFRFIDRLCGALKSSGVEMLDSAELILKDGTLEVGNSHKQYRISTDTGVDVYWTAGLPSLASHLGLSSMLSSLENTIDLVFVTLVLDVNVFQEPLYYLYCYDEGFATHRVTNYNGYCPLINEGRGFTVNIELWPHKINLDIDDPSINWVEVAICELKRMGLLESVLIKESSVKYSKHGSIIPTIENQRTLERIRDAVDRATPPGYQHVGLLSRRRSFFLPEILRDLHAVLDD